MLRNEVNMCAVWLIFGFLSPCFAQVKGPVELAALGDDERAAYQAVEHDPRPKSLTRNSHYVVSDEKDHHLLREPINGIGGAYIGVGTNQNYEFIPWAQSDVVFLLDFDQVIVDLHAVYRLAFEHSADPAAFVKFWSRSNVKTVEALIKQHISTTQKQQAALAAYRMARVATLGKLKRLVRLHKTKRVASYLTSIDQYQYIVKLFRTGRVFRVRGDLTAQKTMRQIGDALKRFNRYLGVIYVSNCEQYFHRLPQAYRDNMLRFPVSERSLVLRTRPWLESIDREGSESKPKTCANCKTRGTLHYAYMYQDFKNLRTWLTDSNTTSLWQMVSKRDTRVKHRAYHQARLPKSK